MTYLQAENLKHKRTFLRRLLFIAPFITVLMNVLAPLWFQINSYNWWYVLLCPGFLTLICSLAEQRDNGKLKYRAVIPLPVSLRKIWKAKIGIAAIYFFMGNLIFLILNLIGGFAILAVCGLPLTISVGQAVSGTACIVLGFLWEIPLCLWLSKKFGIFVTVILNSGIGSVLGVLAATSSFWIFCPYSWVSHLMISVLGIMPNGEPVVAQTGNLSIPTILITVLISLALFIILSFCTIKWFEKQEVK